MRMPLVTLSLIAVLATGCSGPILANPPAVQRPVALPSPRPSTPPDPRPVVLPRDDAAHQRLTEWWYYTGHLRDDQGHRWGFEFVIFRAERGGFPVTWASHVAVTDESSGTFAYAQRAEFGPQVDRSPADLSAFSLAIQGSASDRAAGATPWAMSSVAGPDRLIFDVDQRGPLAMDLSLDAAKPPALHGGDGWIDLGPAGGSYYYSRTRMAVSGVLRAAGIPVRVEGIAWFDHQWGDFISVGGGGWDWFAVNLDDGTDLTISLVRAADGTFPLIYGTLVDHAGRARNLGPGAFDVMADPGRTWTSPATGATYPAGWTIRLPGEDLVINLTPTVADQELDTRITTGVVYWEGSQVVAATRGGVPVGGQAYVELTGYAPAAP